MLSWSLLLLDVSANAAKVYDKCYCRSHNNILSQCLYGTPAVPCGPPNSAGYSQCCAAGDTCGESGFCHFTHPQDLTSGFYLGGCTDPVYEDSSCAQPCTDLFQQDVVYNRSTGSWSCCFHPNNGLDCGNPGDESFKAAAPEQLFANATSTLTFISSATLFTSLTTSSTISTSSSASQAVSTSSSSSSPSSTSVTSASSPNASAVPVGSSDGLSTGAKAGIGVGVALAVLFGAAAMYFILVILRKVKPHQAGSRHSPVELADRRQKHLYEAAGEQRHEIANPKPRTSHPPAYSPGMQSHHALELE